MERIIIASTATPAANPCPVMAIEFLANSNERFTNNSLTFSATYFAISSNPACALPMQNGSTLQVMSGSSREDPASTRTQSTVVSRAASITTMKAGRRGEYEECRHLTSAAEMPPTYLATACLSPRHAADANRVHRAAALSNRRSPTCWPEVGGAA
eukprot:CAMPEP_0172757790 /NCGR_PEP_ID=MMETSP1074-20121228/164474_1 /TAXON_ID=2916 /ORGANISM="Ceratium fusus, Strain PA161109" /LENGTH=155 /DNA_ID=CAMNT_0013591259 /DNA_START=558 /DNA_END=1025 /DNA_ORIENTATION=+